MAFFLVNAFAIQSNLGFSFSENEFLNSPQTSHGWFFQDESPLVEFQVVTSDFSRDYLIDFKRSKAFVFTDNFFSEDFWFYKSPFNQVKTFLVESNCRLKIYQLHENGGFETEAFFKNETSSLILIDDDELFFSLQPLEETLCEGKISDGEKTLGFKIDFALVESNEDFVKRFVYPCSDGGECFRTSSGEEVNVTEWEARGCPFENIRQGNSSCQAWYTNSIESQLRETEKDNNKLREQSSPELAKKIDSLEETVKNTDQKVIDSGFWVLVFVLLLLGGVVIAMWYKQWTRAEDVNVIRPAPKLVFDFEALKKQFSEEKIRNLAKILKANFVEPNKETKDESEWERVL